MIPRILPLALALLAPVAALAQAPACPRFFPGGEAPALVNARLAQRTTVLCNDAYAVLASGVTHGALWSAEHPDLYTAVLRHKAVLDRALLAHLREPPRQRSAMNLLRLGAVQLLYLKTPPHAAVGECVELAKRRRLAPPGLVNAEVAFRP